MTRNVTLDNPVMDPADDEFNRVSFSKRLADTLATMDTSEGAPVVGLFGKWGDGKTTVLNFVRSFLKDCATQCAVFSFNPWLFKDQEALLREFYAGLARSIAADVDKPNKKLGEFLRRYGGITSSLPLVGSSLSKALEAFGNELSADTTSAQKERLAQLMLEADTKVVVLIDDLDRLDRDELMAMLKLVRVSANVPNVLYVLAFDQERVARLAAQSYGDANDGQQFLEKIIQYPFSLPTVESNDLIDFVVRHAHHVCNEVNITIKPDDWSKFRDICKGSLRVALDTPRQAIRYANALRFALPMLKGEVEPYDQLIVEAVRILFPTLYQEFRKGADYKMFGDIRLPKNHEKAATDLINALSHTDREKFKAFSNDLYRYKYFLYAVKKDDVSNLEIEEILTSCLDVDQENLNRLVRGLARHRLPALLNHLKSLTERYPEVRQTQGLAIALSLCGDLSQVDDPLNGQTIEKSLIDLISDFATYFPKRQAEENMVIPSQVLEVANPLPFALDLYRKIASISARKKEGPKVTTWEHFEGELNLDWEDLRKKLSQRIKNEADEIPPYIRYAPHLALEIIHFWQDIDFGKPKEWLEQRIKAYPGEASKFLSLFDHNPTSFSVVPSLVDPTTLTYAIRSSLGAALEDEDKNSEELRTVRQFLSYQNGENGTR